MRFGAIANTARGGPRRPPSVGDRVEDVSRVFHKSFKGVSRVFSVDFIGI